MRGWGAATTEPDPLPSPGVHPTPGRAERASAAVPGAGGKEGWGSGRGGHKCEAGGGPGSLLPRGTWTPAPKEVKVSAFRGALFPFQDLPSLVPTPLEEAPNAPSPPPPWGLGSDRAREPPAPGVWPGASAPLPAPLCRVYPAPSGPQAISPGFRRLTLAGGRGRSCWLISRLLHPARALRGHLFDPSGFPWSYPYPLPPNGGTPSSGQAVQGCPNKNFFFYPPSPFFPLPSNSFSRPGVKRRKGGESTF